VEAGSVADQESLIEWLDADLRHGSGWNEAIFFREAWHRTAAQDTARLAEISELAAAYRGTSELALEASQQAASCMATLRAIWPDPFLQRFSEGLVDRAVAPTLSVLMAVRTAREEIPVDLALPAFLQSYIANLVAAGVRLIPLGQIGGQRSIAALEQAVLSVSQVSAAATLDDLGSAAFMVDLASAAHETQYTRLFRS
jgi:urease accessory protein